MKQFLLGLFTGACLLAAVYFAFSFDHKPRVAVGRVLDLDYIYMNDGSLIKGWIMRKDRQNYLIETKEGTFTLPVAACVQIDENIFLRFLRAAI